MALTPLPRPFHKRSTHHLSPHTIHNSLPLTPTPHTHTHPHTPHTHISPYSSSICPIDVLHIAPWYPATVHPKYLVKGSQIGSSGSPDCSHRTSSPLVLVCPSLSRLNFVRDLLIKCPSYKLLERNCIATPLSAYGALFTFVVLIWCGGGIFSPLSAIFTLFVYRSRIFLDLILKKSDTKLTQCTFTRSSSETISSSSISLDVGFIMDNVASVRNLRHLRASSSDSAVGTAIHYVPDPHYRKFPSDVKSYKGDTLVIEVSH